MSGSEQLEPLPERNREALTELTETYSLFQRFIGIGSVIFTDEATRAQYSDTTGRSYIYQGNILDAGQDEVGPWALLDITYHVMQLESIDEVMPGYNEFIDSFYPPIPENFINRLAALDDVKQQFPGISSYIDLPIEENPVKFYLKDMPACIFVSNVPNERN